MHGLNHWSYASVLESVIDIGHYESGPTKDIPFFNHRLVAFLPSLIEHQCSEGVRGGFLQRLESGTWMGHVLEHVAIELQRLAGLPFAFGQTRQINPCDSKYYMVFASSHEEIAKTALQHATVLLDACVYGDEFDIHRRLKDLAATIEQYDGGVELSNQMVRAKLNRIPYVRKPNAHCIQWGYGGGESHRLIGIYDETQDGYLMRLLTDMLTDAGLSHVYNGREPWSMLSNKDAKVSIIETTLSSLESQGLVYQYPHCYAAVISKIDSEEHLKFYRCLVDAIGPDGFAILNIDNDAIYILNKYVEGKIFYYSMQSSVEHLRDKLQNNNVLFWERNQKIFCWENQQEKCLGKIKCVDKKTIQNILICICIAKCFDIPEHVVFSFIKNVVLNHLNIDL